MEPGYQDRVKHKYNTSESTTGTVIAKYPGFGKDIKKQFLDVRTDDDRIIYETPAENWEIVQTEEERFRKE